MFVALALALIQDPLERTLDFAPETARMEVLCRELSTKVGMPVRVHPDLKDEVMCVAVSGVKGRDLLEHLAKDLEGSLVVSGGEAMITQTDADRLAQRKREDALRLKEVEDQLAKVALKSQLDKPFGAAEAEILARKVSANWTLRGGQEGMDWYRGAQEYDVDAPGSRFLARLVQMLPKAELAAMAAKDRQVFSDQPNRVQRGFRADLREPYARLINEQALFVAALQKVGAKAPTDFQSFMASDWTAALSKAPSRVLVIAESEPFQGLTLRACLLDEKGKLINEFSTSGAGNPFEELNKPGAPDDLELEPDALSKELITSLMGAEQGAPKVSPALMERLLALDQIDPLGFGMTSMARQIHTKGKLQIVANLGEASFVVLSMLAGGPKSTRSRMERGLMVAGHEIDVREGWWTVRQSTPLRNRESRPSRVVLGDFFRKQAGKPVRLLDLARLAASFSPKTFTEIMEIYLAIPLKFGMGRARLGDPWMRFLGSLAPASLDNARKEQKLRVGQLSKREQEALRDLVYSRADGWMTRDDAPRPSGDESPMIQERSLTEPTELVPNGLGPDQEISLRVAEETVAVLDGASGLYRQTAFSPSELAWEAIQTERPDLFGAWAGREPKPANPKYRLAKRDRYDFELWLNKTVGKTGNLEDVYDATGNAVALDALPEAFRKQVDDRLKEMRAAYKDVKPGDFGGTRKPPPPRRV